MKFFLYFWSVKLVFARRESVKHLKKQGFAVLHAMVRNFTLCVWSAEHGSVLCC